MNDNPPTALFQLYALSLVPASVLINADIPENVAAVMGPLIFGLYSDGIVAIANSLLFADKETLEPFIIASLIEPSTHN